MLLGLGSQWCCRIGTYWNCTCNSQFWPLQKRWNSQLSTAQCKGLESLSHCSCKLSGHHQSQTDPPKTAFCSTLKVHIASAREVIASLCCIQSGSISKYFQHYIHIVYTCKYCIDHSFGCGTVGQCWAKSGCYCYNSTTLDISNVRECPT